MAERAIAPELTRAWRRAVSGGKICWEVLLEGEVAGVGGAGNIVVCGVRLATEGDRCEFFACNQTTGREIPNPVVEKPIPGTDFVVQFNRGRAWRPGVKGRQPGRQAEISGAWQDCRFDCQRPAGPVSGNSLLARDPLLRVELPNGYWHAYHNIAPFEPEGHCIWVPARQEGARTVLPHHPQHLTREFLADLLSIRAMGAPLLFFFNSLHGGASVNHIHAQSVAYRQPLALERAIAASELVWHGDVGLLEGYPARVLVFDGNITVDRLFPYIDRLQTHDEPIPFNLLLLKDWIGIAPRNIDNEVLSELPGEILGAMGIAGKLIATHPETYIFFDAGLDVLNAICENVCLPRWQVAELLSSVSIQPGL